MMWIFFTKYINYDIKPQTVANKRDELIRLEKNTASHSAKIVLIEVNYTQRVSLKRYTEVSIQ